MRIFSKKIADKAGSKGQSLQGEGKVLVVDDSPTELHILKGFLEDAGYKVLLAENGESGIEMARSSKPDLVLMDVVMPGLNGFQATRQLSRDPETEDIPVIMVPPKTRRLTEPGVCVRGQRSTLSSRWKRMSCCPESRTY